MKNFVVIKIGGSVVTHKESITPSINYKNISLIASQIKSFLDRRKCRLLIVNGNGSCGHQVCKESKIDRGFTEIKQSFALATTQRLVTELNLAITTVFQKNGLPALPCQIANALVAKNGRINFFNIKPLQGFFELGLIPVVPGTAAFDIVKGCSIISGDQLVPYLAKKLGAQKIIEISDVEGIFTADPKLNKGAKLISNIGKNNFKNVVKNITGSLSADISGGMKQKYLELVDAAKSGIACQIVHFKSLKDALEGKPVGTTINLKNEQ